MAARLYPGFGSGRGTFEGEFTAKAFGAGSPMELGDKLILPQAALKAITRLKLPLPFVFRVGAASPSTTTTSGRRPQTQVAGVVEFSAAVGVAVAPQWMLEALGLREGSRLRVTTLPTGGLPPGEFARFAPDDPGFAAAAASSPGGARVALEAALRSYSALAVGQRLPLAVGGAVHTLRVVDLRPAPCVSLYGSVDLSVEVDAPLGEGPLCAVGGPQGGDGGAEDAPLDACCRTAAPVTPPPVAMTAESVAAAAKPSPPRGGVLVEAEQQAEDSAGDPAGEQGTSAVVATVCFPGEGHALGGGSSGGSGSSAAAAGAVGGSAASACARCGAAVPAANAALHAARCGRGHARGC